MKEILVINCGSSSLKFDLVEMDEQAPSLERAKKAAHGGVDRIGPEATLEMSAPGHDVAKHPVPAANYTEAVRQALSALASIRGVSLASLGQTLFAVGHRVVHGGSQFTAPTPIDSDLMASLDSLAELAPLHNPAAIEGIKAAAEILGSAVPMFAVFDTAFHSTLPPHAYTYAIPHELAEKYNIRRYGFHGIAHEFMLDTYCRIAGIERESATIITLQLGNGCSAAAIKNGQSVDTSMGFTPLEGLVMGTRSGDLDPEIVAYLAEKEAVAAGVVTGWLNKQSGLLGISGSTSDMRDLLSAMDTSADARLAVELFCYRARKYIGAYMAALGGAQAIVFGGGIGENAAAIRERICEDMEWCGLQIDKEQNMAASGKLQRISKDGSRVEAYIVPVVESLLIARSVVRCMAGARG